VKTLGTIMQEAIRQDIISSSPVRNLQIRREEAHQKPEISGAEQKLIEEALATENHPLVADWMPDCWTIAIKQGCRLREVEVPLDRVDLAGSSIVFRIKGGRLHPAPLHAEVALIARRRQEAGHHWLCQVPAAASKKWRAFFDGLGMPHLTFHCTRVTVVTRLARAGYSEAQTMQYVGHSSEEVHAIYRRLRPADVHHLGNVL
jgi:integrase